MTFLLLLFAASFLLALFVFVLFFIVSKIADDQDRRNR